ncbi:hypothetical protein P8452_44927 [Trifolium repens]|nr:hypothetical protein P8452_44927 [Trifolium repens]
MWRERQERKHPNKTKQTKSCHQNKPPTTPFISSKANKPLSQLTGTHSAESSKQRRRQISFDGEDAAVIWGSGEIPTHRVVGSSSGEDGEDVDGEIDGELMNIE